MESNKLDMNVSRMTSLLKNMACNVPCGMDILNYEG
jgi:hypothetical protein